MQWQMIEGRWEEFRNNARETWSQLTDEDLNAVNGNREELVSRLEARCGMDRATAEHEADAWSHRLHVRYEEPGPDPVLYASGP
jgi:uncharacterized protein YjbJ (UPF0337 family)